MAQRRDRLTTPMMTRMNARVRTLRGVRHTAAVLLLAPLAACTLPACEPAGPSMASGITHPESGLPIERITLAGREFELEVAADNDSRTYGLRMRDSLDEDGGMIFVFPRSSVRSFSMPDCFFDIDIIFLGPDGRVTQTRTMTIEPPRGEGEGEAGSVANTAADRRYLSRLPSYSSKFAAQYAIELNAGMIETLGIEPGDVLDVDFELLQSYIR